MNIQEMQNLYEKLSTLIYSQISFKDQFSRTPSCREHHGSWEMTFGNLDRPNQFENELDDLTSQGNDNEEKIEKLFEPYKEKYKDTIEEIRAIIKSQLPENFAFICFLEHTYKGQIFVSVLISKE